MDLAECERNGFIKKTNPSISLIQSLLEISQTKEAAIKRASIDEITINAYLPMAYDALREVLEATYTLHGYKVTNHVCLGELLRKLEPDFDYYSFDRFRYVRNSINYYGKKVGLEEGKSMIDKIMQMRKKHIDQLHSKLKQSGQTKKP